MENNPNNGTPINAEPAIPNNDVQNEQTLKPENETAQQGLNNQGDQNDDLKPKKQRRKKADGAPRDFVCDICQKTYLSLPALSSHKKTKHNVEPEKKSRGRPRKNVKNIIYN